MYFYEILEKLAADKNIPLSKVADDLNIRRATVYDWKKHENGSPSLEIAIKLCDYFNVSMDYIFRGIEDYSIYKSKYENLKNKLKDLISDE